MKLTKEEILAGNRLIGIFMGKSFPSMKYHCNWHWLMPAWYRFVELRFDDPMMQFKHSELKTTVGYAILYGDIKLAFTNLADAVKTIQRLTDK